MQSWLKWAVAVFVMSFAITTALAISYSALSPYWQGVAVESAGVTLEIFLLVLILGAYEKWRSRADEIERLLQRIDDVKKIDDPHAHGIIASAMRQLAKFNKTDLDLRGACLTNFSFTHNDIHSIESATLTDGLQFDYPSKNFTKLKDVDFSSLNCRRVRFGTGNLSFATYEQCTFYDTDLREAQFDGATLKWGKSLVKADEADWYEVVDEEEDGSPITTQVYSPAFDSSDLAGASFKKTRFENAYFRNAKNVLLADFRGATGLETCLFDEGIKRQILKSSAV